MKTAWIGKCYAICYCIYIESNNTFIYSQLISNLLIGFLNTPRGDRKRYDILTIIANVLHLTEEEKEQIGLLRPKQSLGSPLPTAIEQPATEVSKEDGYTLNEILIVYSHLPMHGYLSC